MTQKQKQPQIVDDASASSNGSQRMFYAYCVTTVCGFDIGFDERSMDEVESEWIVKSLMFVRRIVRERREARRHAREVEIVGGERDDDFGVEDYFAVEDDAVCVHSDEVFRLHGIPGTGGLGSYRTLAANVRVISNVSPGDVVEWIKGAEALRAKGFGSGASRKPRRKGARA